jgi:two-component system catabolic regulation response regulator CreB
MNSLVRGIVWVADPERIVLEVVQTRLDAAGFTVSAFRDAAALCARLGAEQPMAIVVDVQLAHRDDWAVLAACRQFGDVRILLTGRSFQADDLEAAHRLGVAACLPKPFSGADIVERTQALLAPSHEPAPLHGLHAVGLDPRALGDRYAHEAGEHRRILFARGSGLCAAWKTFGQFLVDMGPAPDTDHVATRLSAQDLTFGPGRTAWLHRDYPPRLTEPLDFSRLTTTAPDGRVAIAQGRPVDYAVLAQGLRLPVESVATAIARGADGDGLAQQAAVADALAQGGAPWFPPEHQPAFLAAYRVWHSQVQPAFAALATPGFFYLFLALPEMMKSRAGLIELGLWDPPTEAGRAARAAHPLWRRFQDGATRADIARASLAIYRQYELQEEVEDLCERVAAAERRFRTAGRRAQAPRRAA